MKTEITDFVGKVRRDALPCPFCGIQPRLVIDALRNMYRLGCKNSDCNIRPLLPILIRQDKPKDLLFALEAWNKRADPKKSKSKKGTDSNNDNTQK